MAFRKEKGYVTRLFHHHTLPQHIKRTIALSQYNTAQQQNSQRSTDTNRKWKQSMSGNLGSCRQWHTSVGRGRKYGDSRLNFADHV